MRRYSFARILLAAVSASFSASAQAEQILGPYPGGFGASLDMQGDRLVVGAPLAVGGGRVYVFERAASVWSLQHTITSPFPQANEQFGASVGLYYDFLLVGAPGRDETGADSGAVFNLFLTGGQWQYAGTVVGQDTGPNDRFGRSLDVRDNNLIVGVPDHNGGAGAAYIFSQGAIQWFQNAKLTAPSPMPGDAFGSAVAVGLDAAIVGAPGKGAGGAAYAFKPDAGGWTLAGDLAPPAGQPFERVGEAVALDGDAAVVGCPSTDHQHQWTNIYQRRSGAWQYTDTVESYLATCQIGDSGCWLGFLLSALGEPAPGCPFGKTVDADNDCDVDIRDLAIYLAMNPDYLYPNDPKPAGAGRAVAVSGTRVAVGAPHERTFGLTNQGSGAARVHTESPAGYVELNLLAASDAKYDASFGATVAIEGDTVVVAAPDAGGPGVGQVYVFSVAEPPPPSLLSFSLVPVNNTLIPNAQTLDLVVTLSGHPSGYANDWQLASIQATTDGQFYQHPVGGVSSPPYSWIPLFPPIQFDTFVASPFTYPNLEADDLVSYLQPVVQKSTQFTVPAWFDTLPGSLSVTTFVAARLTVIGGTKLELQGLCVDAAVGRETPYALQANLKCRADIDDDGAVGQSDLGALLASYGACKGEPAYDPLADLDFSGCVDQADLGTLLGEWGCTAF